jgi:hypothetical protein
LFDLRAPSAYGGPTLDANTAPSDSAPGTGWPHDHGYEAFLQQPQPSTPLWDTNLFGPPAQDPFSQYGPSNYEMDPNIDNLNVFPPLEAMPWEFDSVLFASNADRPPMPAIGGLPVDFVQDFGPHATVAPQPTAVVAPPTRPNNAPQQTHQARITCSFVGCNKSYVRAGDCRRHMLKHGPPKFKCAVFDCNLIFHRADKWSNHMKQGHKIKSRLE